MAFKVVGGRLVRVVKDSWKKKQKRAINGRCVYDGTDYIKQRERVAAERGVRHPFASDRQALRRFRRQQGGPGITEGSRPEPKPEQNDYHRWLISEAA